MKNESKTISAKAIATGKVYHSGENKCIRLKDLTIGELADKLKTSSDFRDNSESYHFRLFSDNEIEMIRDNYPHLLEGHEVIDIPLEVGYCVIDREIDQLYKIYRNDIISEEDGELYTVVRKYNGSNLKSIMNGFSSELYFVKSSKLEFISTEELRNLRNLGYHMKHDRGDSYLVC
ncbi:gp253 [Sphingomonas phage PAU]|uniref:gp253 n=1 Tax=Sphingomonas phage PAU TaxID=1150991 RepID=UPI0002573403|nr:gp253 [Sphingomonas phage PAU]AFF28251.1 gp253 [Sphingomonas phage PAU]